MRELAKFLGANIVSEKTLNPLITKWVSPNFAPLDGKFVSTHELKFDCDWNWLVVVMDKIHTIKLNGIDNRHYDLFDMLIADMTEGVFKNDIKRVCNDCIELVRYINTHQIKY